MSLSRVLIASRKVFRGIPSACPRLASTKSLQAALVALEGILSFARSGAQLEKRRGSFLTGLLAASPRSRRR